MAFQLAKIQDMSWSPCISTNNQWLLLSEEYIHTCSGITYYDAVYMVHVSQLCQKKTSYVNVWNRPQNQCQICHNSDRGKLSYSALGKASPGSASQMFWLYKIIFLKLCSQLPLALWILIIISTWQFILHCCPFLSHYHLLFQTVHLAAVVIYLRKDFFFTPLILIVPKLQYRPTW